MTNPTPNGRRAIRELPGGRSIAYYPALARIAGGVTAGVFLAQLFYWHDKGADPAGWIYKTQAEWQDEADLTRWEKETARRMGANKDVETRQTSVWESHNHA